MKTPKALMILGLACIILLSLETASFAGPPTDQIRRDVDKVIDILKNKELKKPANERKRRAQIRKVVYGRFDFEDMARRALAIHWAARTPAEKRAFVPLFSDLIERSYIRKIERYSDEKIVYIDEKIHDRRVSVETKVISKGGVETPVEYRVQKEKNKWMVVDVVIDGVSMVENYRSQFNKIIRENSYRELVRKLKNKAEEEGIVAVDLRRKPAKPHGPAKDKSETGRR